MYLPREDSTFFAEFLQTYFKKLSKKQKENLKYLDMGTGSGILSETASKVGIKKQNILAADIDEEAVEFVRKKGFNAIISNLFTLLKKKAEPGQHQIINRKGGTSRLRNKSEALNIDSKFDLITFNAPYLPLDKREPKDSRLATTGGKNGDEISVKFIKQAKKHIEKDGKIFLLISSLTPLSKINRFKPKLVAKQRIFFEDLIILEF